MRYCVWRVGGGQSAWCPNPVIGGGSVHPYAHNAITSDTVRTPYSCLNIHHNYPILISQHACYNIRTHIRLSSLAYHLDMLFFFLRPTNCIAFLHRVVGLHFVVP